MFSGDTFFAKALGRTDLPTGDNSQLVKSLYSIKDVDFDVAYPGHARPASRSKFEAHVDCFKREFNNRQL